MRHLLLLRLLLLFLLLLLSLLVLLLLLHFLLCVYVCMRQVHVDQKTFSFAFGTSEQSIGGDLFEQCASAFDSNAMLCRNRPQK